MRYMFYRVLILSCICLLSKSAFSSEAEQINTEASPSVKSSIVSQDDYEIAFKDVKPLPINDMQWVEARIFIDKPVGFHLSIRNKSDNPYYMQTWYQTYRGNGIQKVEHHSMNEWELPPLFPQGANVFITATDRASGSTALSLGVQGLVKNSVLNIRAFDAQPNTRVFFKLYIDGEWKTIIDDYITTSLKKYNLNW